MLENCQSAKERWGGVNTIVDQWLMSRQELLVIYCSLSDIESFDEKNKEHTQKIRSLCQHLVDYVSAGHFEVYDQLIKEGKAFDNKEALTEAARLYKIIDPNTEVILDFNDKYLETDDLSTLAKDLSEIGQQLVTRFEAEDKMIQVLHMSHREMVA